MALWTLANLKKPSIVWGNVDDIASQAAAGPWPNRGSQGGQLTQSNASWNPAVSANGLGTGVPAVMWAGGQVLELPITLTGPLVHILSIGAYTAGDGGKRLVSLSAHNADYNDDGFAAVMKNGGNSPFTSEIERNGHTTTGTRSITSPCLIEVGFDGTAPFIRVNGVDDVVGSADARSFNATFLTLGGWYLFGSSPVDTWTGPQSDIAVHDYILTGDELDRARASLLWSRKLQSLLPASSAYRSAAPTVGAAAVVAQRRRPSVLMSS